jgi:hypothetical protein
LRTPSKEEEMRSYIQVSGVLFALVALGHLLRVVARWSLFIAGRPLPAMVSLLVVIFAGAMALWAWRVLHAPGALDERRGT